MRFVVIFFGLLVAVSVSAHSLPNTIHMTAAGFEPKTLTIKAGETVTFENIDSRSRWPASNIHPTHTIYPGSGVQKCGTPEEKDIFDACRDIALGKTYSFTFSKEGVWRFHDHNFSQYSGSITVEKSEVSPPPASAPEVAPAQPEEKGFFARTFAGIKNFFRKIFGFFARGEKKEEPKQVVGEEKKEVKQPEEKKDEEPDITDAVIKAEPYNGERITEIANIPARLAGALKSLGVASAMAKLIEESGGGSTFDCHQEAHQIGRIGYQLYKEKTFQACEPACHSGCYHGAMETFLTEQGTADLSKDIDRICSLFATGFGVFECLHGVGHGLLAYLDYDLPETLKECRRLSDSFKQSSCYGGVFMENIVTGQGLGATKGAHVTEWVNRNDPAFPCSGIEQTYEVQYQCWQMQTSWMLTINNYDFAKVAQLCLSAPENMVAVCFRSYGRDAAGHTLRNPERIRELCDNVPRTGTYYNDCVIGAVNVIVDFWGPGLKDQASGLCKILDWEGKQTCYSTVAGRLAGLFANASDRARICNGFEPEYRSLCSAAL